MANRDPPPVSARLSKLNGFFKKKQGKQDDEVLGALPDHLRRSRTTRVASLLLWIGAFGFTVYQLSSLCYAFANREPISSLTPIFKDIPLQMTLHFHLFSIDVPKAVSDFYWSRVNVTNSLKIGDKVYNNLTVANDVLLKLLVKKVESVLSYRGYCDAWLRDYSPTSPASGVPIMRFASDERFNYSQVLINQMLWEHDFPGKVAEEDLSDAYLSLEFDGQLFSNITELEVLHHMGRSLYEAVTVESVLSPNTYTFEPFVTSCSIAIRFTADDITAVDPSQQQISALFVVGFRALPKWVTSAFVNVAFGSGSDKCTASPRGIWIPPGETVDLNRTSQLQHNFHVHVSKYRRDSAYCNAALDKMSIGQYCFLSFAENGSSCVPYLGQNVDHSKVKVCTIENRIEYARHPLSTLPEECGQNFDACFPKSDIEIGTSNPWCHRNERVAINCSFSPILHNIDPTECTDDVVRSIYEKKNAYDSEVHVYRQEELSLLIETKEQFSWTWFLASFAGQLGLFISIAGKSETVYRLWINVKAALRKFGLMPRKPVAENGIDRQNSEMRERPA